MSRSHATIIVLDILFLIVAAYAIWFWNRWRQPVPMGIDAPVEYTVRGIDISSHNGLQLDFSQVRRAGYRFAYIKATEGASFRDSLFNRNYWGARRYGLAVGAYHFFRFDRDGASQAANLMGVLRDHPVHLPVAVDVEEWGNANNVETASIRERLGAMLRTLEQNGYRVVIYTNKRGYNQYIKGHFDGYPLWICSFSNPPFDPDDDDSPEWVVWQHSHIGQIPGLKGNIDLNVFHGKPEDFEIFSTPITYEFIVQPSDSLGAR